LIYGYARVSTDGQSVDAQACQPRAAGAKKVYRETAIGAKTERYRAGGWADIIETVAQEIDATQFNRRFSRTFPRFVQLAVWKYCAQQGLDICNGNQIDDRKRCDNIQCSLTVHAIVIR
jgi:hypothetical protein